MTKTPPGPSYSNTKRMSKAERWLSLTGRSHSVRGASRFRGVTRNTQDPSRPWRASLVFDGRTFFLGSHATEEEAALAWNQAALRHIGPVAEQRLNIITNPAPSCP